MKPGDSLVVIGPYSSNSVADVHVDDVKVEWWISGNQGRIITLVDRLPDPRPTDLVAGVYWRELVVTRVVGVFDTLSFKQIDIRPKIFSLTQRRVAPGDTLTLKVGWKRRDPAKGLMGVTIDENDVSFERIGQNSTIQVVIGDENSTAQSRNGDLTRKISVHLDGVESIHSSFVLVSWSSGNWG